MPVVKFDQSNLKSIKTNKFTMPKKSISAPQRDSLPEVMKRRVVRCSQDLGRLSKDFPGSPYTAPPKGPSVLDDELQRTKLIDKPLPPLVKLKWDQPLTSSLPPRAPATKSKNITSYPKIKPKASAKFAETKSNVRLPAIVLQREEGAGEQGTSTAEERGTRTTEKFPDLSGRKTLPPYCWKTTELLSPQEWHQRKRIYDSLQKLMNENREKTQGQDFWKKKKHCHKIIKDVPSHKGYQSGILKQDKGILIPLTPMLHFLKKYHRQFTVEDQKFFRSAFQLACEEYYEKSREHLAENHQRFAHTAAGHGFPSMANAMRFKAALDVYFPQNEEQVTVSYPYHPNVDYSQLGMKNNIRL